MRLHAWRNKLSDAARRSRRGEDRSQRSYPTLHGARMRERAEAQTRKEVLPEKALTMVLETVDEAGEETHTPIERVDYMPEAFPMLQS